MCDNEYAHERDRARVIKKVRFFLSGGSLLRAVGRACRVGSVQRPYRHVCVFVFVYVYVCVCTRARARASSLEPKVACNPLAFEHECAVCLTIQSIWDHAESRVRPHPILQRRGIFPTHLITQRREHPPHSPNSNVHTPKSTS